MLTSIRGPLGVSLWAGSVLISVPVLADETAPPSDVTVSGSAQVVSDYRFRGISASGGDIAVQGTIDVTHASGFYLGAWASSLRDSPVHGDVEVDLYGGWSGEVGSGLTADVGLTYYVFPDGKVGSANAFEPYASLAFTLGPATAKAGVKYAWNQDALGGEDNLYLYTDLGTSIPNTPVSLSAHLGYTDGAFSPMVVTGSGTGGGFDWSAGATYAIIGNLSVAARYVGVEGASFQNFSNDTVVGTLKFAF